MFLAEHDMQHALQRVQAAFPSFTQWAYTKPCRPRWHACATRCLWREGVRWRRPHEVAEHTWAPQSAQQDKQHGAHPCLRGTSNPVNIALSGQHGT
jgi:hypothetical protein